jgi:hypothetical protein
LPTLLTLMLVAAAAADARAQNGSGQTTTQTARRPLSRTLDAQGQSLTAQQNALTERHTASIGPQAPQVGLDPDWPQKYYGGWDEFKEVYPTAAAPYEPCVKMFRQANDIIKGIAPLTRRPLWDVSGKQIGEATKRASDLVRQGDRCMNDAAAGRPTKPMLQGGVDKTEPAADTPAPPKSGGVTDAGPPPDNGGGIVPLPYNPPGNPPGRSTPPSGGPGQPPVTRIPGGYDPCANPVPPPGCPNAPPANNAPGGSNPPRLNGSTQQTDCTPAPDPRTQQALQGEANEALRTLAACGQQCDIMLTTMGKLSAARLVHLTEANEGIASRTIRTTPEAIAGAAKAVSTYLANDNTANHRMLLGQAEAAIARADQMLKQAYRNPAATVGRVGDSILWAKAGNAAGGVCEATAVRLNTLKQQVDEARKAVQVAKQMEDRAKAVAGNSQGVRCSGSYGTNGPNTPPPGRAPGTGPAAPGGPLAANPFGSNTNCIATSIAGAKREATGRPYTAIDISLADAEPSYGDAFRMLRENFGNNAFPELKAFEQKLQAAGVPRPLSKGGIEAELKAAADRGVQKPQGIVFIDRASGGGHAFNAVWENGRVVYKDYQQGALGQGGLDAAFQFGNATDIAFYRVQ